MICQRDGGKLNIALCLVHLQNVHIAVSMEGEKVLVQTVDELHVEGLQMIPPTFKSKQ